MSDIKYEKDNFSFTYRVSAIIYNKDKTKILLFRGNDSNFYMLPGGKVHELEKSKDAIKREIKEEKFKSIETDWINFEWVDINELNNYEIHPSNVIKMLNNSEFEHLVEEI